MDKIEQHIRNLTRRPEKVRRSFGKLCSVLGFILILSTCYNGKDRIDLVAFGQSIEGTIVSYKPVTWHSRSNGLTHQAFHPVVQFAWEGRDIRFQDKIGLNTQDELNSKVPVLFDPEKPYIAMMDRGYWNFVPWGPFLVLGVILMGSGIRQSSNSSKRDSQ